MRKQCLLISRGSLGKAAPKRKFWIHIFNKRYRHRMKQQLKFLDDSLLILGMPIYYN